jgi:hypothetical protein
MSAGKYLSLEEVRRDPKLLKRFIKQREAAKQGIGDVDRLEDTLAKMVKSSPLEPGTSPKAHDVSSTETQTRQGT